MISPVGRRRTFADLRADGRRVRHGSVRLCHLPYGGNDRGGETRADRGSAPASPQVAFAIGKHFGNAVQRNRGRRRLKEAFVSAWRSGSTERAERLRGAFLLSGTRGLLHDPFAKLVADVDACLDLLATPGEAVSP